MKQILFFVLISGASLVASAQNSNNKPVSYEAADWKVFLLDNPQQIIIDAPPAATETKTELQAIRQKMSKMDANTKERVTFWNAGAPSYRWNQLAVSLISWDNVDIVLRTPASWMNVAVYDATVLAWKEKLKYKRKRPQDIDPSIKPIVGAPQTYSYPCEHTVTAAAAATVLAYFYPGKADSVMKLARAASQSRIEAGLQFPSDVDAGWKLGEQVARQIIEKAKLDGSAKVSEITVNKDPRKWTGAYPLGIKLLSFTPMVMRSADQFRPAPPPDFETEMKDLKNYKQNFRSRSLAYYWANSGPALWNDLVSQKIFEYRIHEDAPAAARIYAALNVAFHEMTIAVFDAKYTYWGIRPVQYDSTYKPLITTPPFPGYPSGHAAGAGTSAAVLEYFFPADAKQFRQIAQECADSRFFAGIHFKTDNETGLRMGEALGRFVAEAWMKK